MSRRGVTLATALACLLAALFSPITGSTIKAANPGKNTTTAPPPPTFVVTVTSPGGTVEGSPGESGEPAPIPCRWSGDPADDATADRWNMIMNVIGQVITIVIGRTYEITVTFYSQDNVLHRYNSTNNQFETREVADCSNATAPNGVTTSDFRWVTVQPPSPDILLPGTIATATGQISFPTPDISPPDKAPINLGLWLAVEPAGPFTIRAALGPIWAESAATLTTTSFDPGNGDPPIVCATNGSPIPASAANQIEQGPCGYTYRNHDDLDTQQITITSTWTVTWTLSDGRTGTQPAITTTTALPYQIYEIQTIGRTP